jgi:hypothetical protein
MDRIILLHRIAQLEGHVGDGQQYEGRAAEVSVIGGLPALPGANVAMPRNVERVADGKPEDNAEPGGSPGSPDADIQACDPDRGGPTFED